MIINLLICKYRKWVLTNDLTRKSQPKTYDFVTTPSIFKCTPIKRSINIEGNSPDTKAATFQEDIKPEYVAKNVLLPSQNVVPSDQKQ